MKLSIKEYASMMSISPQAVYQAINKGKLNVVVKDGKKYIVVEPEAIKAVDEPVAKVIDEELVKDLFKQLKAKDKEIKRLTKQLLKCSQSKEEVFVGYINELKQMRLAAPVDDDVIDVKASKKKSKKKRKK